MQFFSHLLGLLGSTFPTLLGRFSFFSLRVSSPGNFPPPLAPKEERCLFSLIAQGDKEARRTVIEHNLRLVAHIIKKYGSCGTDQDDLMSLGTIGLIKAVDTFRPDCGTHFATYASKCLQNEILMYFRSRKKLCYEVPLGDTIDTDKDGNPLTYMDIISVKDTIAEDLDRRMGIERALRGIDTLLTPREREIIVLRYGLGGRRGMPQREIAAKLGISRSYVSRIEKRALVKLREGM